ncbi:FAD/NAD(P)-binding protein [Texcoconibacillus texcoconensis]|uniref:Cation diffusion facilitator CzcD-associated flavoprotein CzcO n=1 Tax=Texcoconibacillus texcoconensis TaxID=1095777 RepID=A0A840QMN5_9BACI|nr:FAD/NAD(P)-binding protein [Texcoconibacillus texcoconensis]MBB5172601.1 cation diffusion facilitator CzcD-associated flavoprotein CzcO [Texcoconibacillus texcoconensis]
MFEWIIIGGGIHGCTIANYLIKSGKTKSDNLRIVDPNPEPLFEWKRKTELIGMEFLRSPSVHHIDIDPFSLKKYAKYRDKKSFYGPYDRPSLHLFKEHCNNTINEVDLHNSWVQGKVNNVTKETKSWRVQTTNDKEIYGENIVIAISMNHQLHLPDWVESLNTETEQEQIYHVFDERLTDINKLSPPVTVVGGGITAAHTTIKLSSLYPGQVTLLKRHPFRINSFDSDPGWLGPKYMSSFQKVKDFDKRRQLINQARNKGSLPRELYRKLIRLEKNKLISIIDREVVSGNVINGEGVKLDLKGGNILFTQSVLLATGFIASLPKEKWLTKLIDEKGLQCAKCGYPIVKPSLEWCNHLYVSGPLSELEIGPVARNISGARKVAERIVSNLN